jgi:hypothetical protein
LGLYAMLGLFRVWFKQASLYQVYKTETVPVLIGVHNTVVSFLKH